MSEKKSKTVKMDGEAFKEKIVHAALGLAVAQGWENTTLRDIAIAADVSLADLYAVIEDKNDILVLLGRMIDKAVVSQVSVSGGDVSSPRDALFDILMDRYDTLNDYREGLVAVLQSFRYDPKQMVISMPHLCRSMSWMLECAGIETSGLKGAIKVAGLSGVYLKVLKVWMEDESDDLSKTMAALDKTLNRAEKAADMFGL